MISLLRACRSTSGLLYPSVVYAVHTTGRSRQSQSVASVLYQQQLPKGRRIRLLHNGHTSLSPAFLSEIKSRRARKRGMEGGLGSRVGKLDVDISVEIREAPCQGGLKNVHQAAPSSSVLLGHHGRCHWLRQYQHLLVRNLKLLWSHLARSPGPLGVHVPHSVLEIACCSRLQTPQSRVCSLQSRHTGSPDTRTVQTHGHPRTDHLSNQLRPSSKGAPTICTPIGPSVRYYYCPGTKRERTRTSSEQPDRSESTPPLLYCTLGEVS